MPRGGKEGLCCRPCLLQQGLSLRASISPVFSQREEHPGTQRCFQELFPAMAFWPELLFEPIPMAGWRGGAIRFSAGQVKVLEMPSSWALQLGHPTGVSCSAGMLRAVMVGNALQGTTSCRDLICHRSVHWFIINKK